MSLPRHFPRRRKDHLMNHNNTRPADPSSARRAGTAGWVSETQSSSHRADSGAAASFATRDRRHSSAASAQRSVVARLRPGSTACIRFSSAKGRPSSGTDCRTLRGGASLPKTRSGLIGIEAIHLGRKGCQPEEDDRGLPSGGRFRRHAWVSVRLYHCLASEDAVPWAARFT